MAEQHRYRPGAARGLVERVVAGCPRGGLGTTVARYRHRHAAHRVQAESGERGGHGRGLAGGTGLQPMIDGDPPGAQAEAGSLVGQRGGQGQ